MASRRTPKTSSSVPAGRSSPPRPLEIVRPEGITFDPSIEGHWFVVRFVETPDRPKREAIARAFEDRVRSSFVDPERCDPWRWADDCAVICMHAREGAPDPDLDFGLSLWPVAFGAGRNPPDLHGDFGNSLWSHLARILEGVHGVAPIEAAAYWSDTGGEVDEAFETARAEARDALALEHHASHRSKAAGREGAPTADGANGPVLVPLPKPERPRVPKLPKWFASKQHTVDDVIFLPDGRILVVGLAVELGGVFTAITKAVYVFDGADGELISKSELFPAGGPLDARAAVHPSGRRVIVPNPIDLREVDIESGAARRVWAPDEKPDVYANGGVFPGNECRGVAWLGDDRLVVTTMKGIRILEQRGDDFVVKVRGPRGDGGHVVASPDGRLVLAASFEKRGGRLYGVDGNRIVELAKLEAMSSPRAVENRLFAPVKAVLHELVGGEVAWERAFRGAQR